MNAVLKCADVGNSYAADAPPAHCHVSSLKWRLRPSRISIRRIIYGIAAKTTIRCDFGSLRSSPEAGCKKGAKHVRSAKSSDVDILCYCEGTVLLILACPPAPIGGRPYAA